MGKKSTTFRGNTGNPIGPTQQEINQLIEAFKQRRYAETERLSNNMTVRFPSFSLGWNGLGTALLEQLRYNDALVPLQRAVTLQPQDAQAHNNLGNVFLALLRYTEAEKHYRHALESNPNFAIAHNNLGGALYEQKQYEEAESCCRRSLSLMPTPAAYDRLATILIKQNRYAEAEASYHKALKINPHLIETIIELGHLQMNKGEMEQAETLFLRALSINSDDIGARLYLTKLKKVQRDDENFLALVTAEKQIRKSKLPLPKNMAAIHFALGKSYVDIEEHDKSFSHFISGCKLQRATMQYDSRQETLYFDRIIEAFDSTSLSRLSGGENTSPLPIFVVGMPRSGTTLTEQIIASHPDIHGAGEISDFMFTVTDDAPYPDNLSGTTSAKLGIWGDTYIKALLQYAPEAQRITDKTPGNFMMIGLIHAIFPNAKIIHVSRHPLDNCLSCFTQLFQDGQPYSYDLAELGQYYADYVRLMEHWRKVLPSHTFLDVRYEDIIADKETQARRLIEYCELPWDDACLNFHKNKRSVYTASVTQVRQPIYTSSVARWKPYEKFLDPLIKALGDSTQKFESPLY